MTWPISPVSYPLAGAEQGAEVVAAVAEWAPVLTEAGSSAERTYYDTFDWRIYQDGGTLEFMRDGWSLRDREGRMRYGKTAGPPPGFAGELPEGELRKALEDVISMRRLLARVTVSKASRIIRILDDEEKTVARISIESGSARLPEGDEAKPLPGRLRVLPVRGYTREFHSVITFLESRFPLIPDSRGDLEVALGAVGRKPADYSSKIDLTLDPDLSAADAARLIHRRLLSTMMRNEEGTRADIDSEFLHDFRVAIRRTRSALTQIKGVFPHEDVERFKVGFAALGRATGATRDLDVWRLKFDGYRDELPVEARPELEPLAEFLRAEQRREHRKMVAWLDSEEYARLVEDWRSFLARATPKEAAPPNAQRPVREVASERIRRVFRRVLEGGTGIGPDSPHEALHRLRIECKKLRYLLEFFQSLYEPDVLGRIVKSLKRLQDNLGDFNDYEVQQASLREFARRMNAPPETLMVMGRLVQRLEEGQAGERARFHDCFEQFARENPRSRIKRIFEASGGSTGVAP